MKQTVLSPEIANQVFQAVAANYFLGGQQKAKPNSLQTGWAVAAASKCCVFEDTAYQIIIRDDARIYITREDDFLQAWFSPQQIFQAFKADINQAPLLEVVADKLQLTFTATDGKTYYAYMDKYQTWSIIKTMEVI